MILESVSPKYLSCLRDESGLVGRAEEICFPETEEAVAEAMRSGAGKKITLQGGKTGLVGGCVPDGGRIINLSRMTKLGEVCETPEGATLYVQCGVTLDEIQKKAQGKELIFPPNPTESGATAGGMFATAGAGPNSLFYGCSSQYVAHLQWVTPAGVCWDIPRGAYKVENGKLPLPDGRKIPALMGWKDGTDLIEILSGTEGYLGAAVSMELRLRKQAEDLWGVVFFFETQPQAMDFGKALLPLKEQLQPVHLTTAEFYDGETLKLLESHMRNPLLAGLTEFPQGVTSAIYVELEGTGEEESAQALMMLLDLFESLGGKEEHSWAENGIAAVQRFRDMRHAVPSILNELPEICRSSRGIRWETDFAGREENFPETLAMYHAALQETGLRGAVYGHLLENRLRLALLPETPQEEAAARMLAEKLTVKVLAEGGNPAAEYGVGKVKRELLKKLLSEEEKESLRALRHAFDPEERMNP